MADIPKCEVPDCSNSAQITGNIRKDGSKVYRRRKDTGYVCDKHHKELTAKSQGLTSEEWVNKDHPYRKSRKKYCENQDGRLGYKCTTTIVHSVQLDVDHIDGNPTNHDPSNLQTLCKCCHAYKTIINRDYKSAGRKRLRDTHLTDHLGVL